MRNVCVELLRRDRYVEMKDQHTIFSLLAGCFAFYLGISGIQNIVAHSVAKRTWQVIRLNPMKKYFLGVTPEDENTLKTETIYSSPAIEQSYNKMVASPSAIFSSGFRSLFVASPTPQVLHKTNTNQTEQLNATLKSPIQSPVSPSSNVFNKREQTEIDKFIAVATVTLSGKRPLTRQLSDSMLAGDKRQRTVDESAMEKSTLYHSSSSLEESPLKTPPKNRKKASAIKRRLSSGDLSPEVIENGGRTIKRLEVLEDFLERQREQHTFDVLASQPLLSLFDSETMGSYSVATRPVAEMTTISTLTSNPLVDEIWTSLHVSNTVLYEWTKRIRNWISVTILSPIAVEIKNLNNLFTESNLTNDLRFGQSSISTIRSSFDRFQAAGYSQTVCRRIEMLCRFIDTDSHQTYIVNRVTELARAGYLHGFSWNGQTPNHHAHSSQPIKDGQLLFDLFLNYMDAIQPKNSIFPDGRTFSRRYFVKAPNKPCDPMHSGKHSGSNQSLTNLDTNPPMIQIYQPDESVPHFELYLRGKRVPMRRSNNNLFHVLLLFFYIIIKRPQLIEPPRQRPQRRSTSGGKTVEPPSTEAPLSFEAAIATLPAVPLLGPLRLDKAGLNLVSIFDATK